MPTIIRIKTEGDIFKAVKSLNRIKKRLPVMTRLGMRRWGKILEKDLKRSAKAAGIKSSGKASSLQGTGIRYEQAKRSNVGKLFMRIYGIYLDSMKPHFVTVNRRRTQLLAWAKRARHASIKKKARMVAKGTLKLFSIFVRPHPFIATGYRRARSKLRAVLKRAARRGVSVT